MHALVTDRPMASFEARVDEWLRRHAVRVAPMKTGQWRVGPSNNGEPPIFIGVDGDWIVVERSMCDFELSHPRDLWRRERRLLGAQRALPSGARAVLPAGERQVRMRAERYVSAHELEQNSLWRWLESALADVDAMFERSAGATHTTSVAAPKDTDEQAEAGQPDLGAACEQAGWAATQRGESGAVSVRLPGQGQTPATAIVERLGARARFQVAIEARAQHPISPLSRTAVALALLRTAAYVRLVQFSVVRSDQRFAAVLDVELALPLEPERVDHALSALAIAHRHVAAEIDALAGDRSLAHAYLCMQGLG